MGSYVTVLQTEVIAIPQCAYKAQEFGIRWNIRIFSDGRAAILVPNGTRTTSLLVWECYEALNSLATKNRVTLLSFQLVTTSPTIFQLFYAFQIIRFSKPSKIPFCFPFHFMLFCLCNVRLVRWCIVIMKKDSTHLQILPFLPDFVN